MSILDQFDRVTRKRPCPICSKPDWCLIGRSGGSFADTVVCKRAESRRHFGDAGYFHRLGAWHGRPLDRTRFALRLAEHGPDPRLAELAAVSLLAGGRAATAGRLGVSERSLALLGAGVVTEQIAEEFDIAWASKATTFPMTDVSGKVVGIRLRLTDGAKRAVRGSHEGLFVPQQRGGLDPLLVCEGPTDTAAMLDLGFDAVGRPSCSGGTEMLAAFVSRHRVRDVVIVADRDDPGERGARRLAKVLVARVRRLRLIEPPIGFKDIRAWRRASATAGDVRAAIQAAPQWSVTIRSAAGRA